MSIVTDRGIVTTELCTDSKKYLSQLLSERLLIGAQIKNPNLISWEALLRTEASQQGGEELAEYVNRWIKKLHPEWDGKSKANLKECIINKLHQLETNYLPERLKPYAPETKKQQEELLHKKHALIAIAITVGLAIAFPFALPLLGGATILAIVSSSVIGVALLCYSVAAFVGERLIDSEWVADYSREKEKWQKKIATIKETTEEQVVSNKPLPVTQQTKQITLNKATNPLRVDTATQTSGAKFFVNVILKLPSKGIEQENSSEQTIQCRTS